MGKDWRWWFRRDCKAIASHTSTDEGISITLCRRWRWHGGTCRS